MSFNNIYEIAGSGMRSQTLRLNTVASNLANVNSAASSEKEAYHALKPVFSTIYQTSQETLEVTGASVNMLGVTQSQQTIDRRYEPENTLANKDGYVFYSNVNAVGEMADMMSASRSFESSAEVMRRVNSMQQSLLRLGQG
ncbi:flagellar basal body rod protein FlgC [Moritella viscosa]|uniref:Flagellar basal-body rod protein FlgC n=1 Tax=Moritella viscosa TaxID=80854 RepID=A0A090IG46_9GAMM|nr:flagellar basal body rod protein FlgC [Moritella viscosa]CED58789.1 flagellar basal-body rod protein FlgC [Moritella viscosa]SGY83703.1 LfgC [Moritella viscosa]SGY84270.1 LfgC [Moritella viscosa]SGY84387.1 LfgC [Moritella viscosa]SGY85014.1 LfgC [Moritella viscosa]